MNKDRARYIYSQTDDSQYVSQDSLIPIGCSANFGSNTTPSEPRHRLDSYRPFSHYPDSYSRGDYFYRPDDFYRPGKTRRPDISVHRDEPDRQDNSERQNGRLSPYHDNDSRHYESPCRWDEPRRREPSARPNGSRQAADSYNPDGSRRRGQIKTKEVIENKDVIKNETKLYSLHKRKRSDGRLSPWDDIHPPPKKPRQQDAWEGGLPWDDFEAPRENNKRDSADSAAAKHVIAIDHEPAPIDNSKKAVASLGVAKAAGEPTEAEWEQAGIEANAFLEALGRELAECPELETSANLRNQGNSDSPTYSSASPVSSACQYHSPANSVPDDDEDSFMDDVLDDIAEPTRSKGCKIDEDQPWTLKSLQRDPPYDSDVLNLFRCKRDSHVYINVARRRNAVDFYTETEEERATVSMSNLAV
ncbi:hypothetical protein CGRA01v4_02861 [Colletotrichum graminicola]|nr:hypothetical protein CGRA01v4_02861 [Colletotrichum graminicola]